MSDCREEDSPTSGQGVAAGRGGQSFNEDAGSQIGQRETV